MAQSRPLRIAMVCGYRPTPAGGGTEKHVYELAHGLLKRGIHVEIICEDRPFLPDADNPLASRIVGVAPESLRPRSRIEQFMEKSERFSELIDPSRYDIVHCHGQYGYHIALRWTRLERRPLLISGFHLTALGPIERYKQLGLDEPEETPIDRAVGFMEHAMAYLSDYCIAVSRGVAREIVEFYGVPPERVQVIANWYDPSVFRQSDSKIARCLLNLKTAERYLIYVGHFKMSRGKIMAEILRRLPHDITLLVAHHEEDGAIIAEFGDRVRFIGHSTPQTMALYYSAADLLCFPSLYGGFGLVLVEAMACGCPPVVFDYAAMNELVTGDSGYLVAEPRADAYSAVVERALSDRRKKASAARRRAQTFHMDPQIEAVLDLYHRLAGYIHRGK
ncbi:MAG: glycosyltransferase family 4 protein [Candidatus Cybelea sp.]